MAETVTDEQVSSYSPGPRTRTWYLSLALVFLLGTVAIFKAVPEWNHTASLTLLVFLGVAARMLQRWRRLRGVVETSPTGFRLVPKEGADGPWVPWDKVSSVRESSLGQRIRLYDVTGSTLLLFDMERRPVAGFVDELRTRLTPTDPVLPRTWKGKPGPFVIAAAIFVPTVFYAIFPLVDSLPPWLALALGTALATFFAAVSLQELRADGQGLHLTYLGRKCTHLWGDVKQVRLETMQNQNHHTLLLRLESKTGNPIPLPVVGSAIEAAAYLQAALLRKQDQGSAM